MTINELRKDRTTRKGWIRKLDKIVSEIVIMRDRKCICCGTDQKLTCGHLFSRVAYSTRWDLENCYAQCLSCNFRHEYDPYPMIQKVSEKHGVGFIDELHSEFVRAVPIKTFQLKTLYESMQVIKRALEYEATT